MPQEWRSGDRGGTPGAKELVAWLAARQFGLVARRQLLALGTSEREVKGWVRAGYLYRQLPGVYAVGHTAPSTEASLAAALLWAGPGAMLSHGTGVWWLGLTDRRPNQIHLSTPRRLQSRRGIVVHARCEVKRVWRRRLPVAPIAELLRQFATIGSEDDLRYALAQADYHRRLNLDEIAAVCGRGRKGSSQLKHAMARHLPQLAVTRSRFERRLLYLCEKHHLPIPECNVPLNGFRADALWREHRLIVELDGKDGHLGWDRIRSDHHRDLIHRQAGFTTLRYVWDQFTEQGEVVAADIAAHLT